MSPRARPTILLVDDEPHSLSAMKMALEDEFEILAAPDAAMAGKMLEEQWVQAIFCDQRMPGQSGVAFLTDVRHAADSRRIELQGRLEELRAPRG